MKLYLTSVFCRRFFFFKANVAQLFVAHDEQTAIRFAKENAVEKLPQWKLVQVETKVIDVDELIDKVYRLLPINGRVGS